MLITALIFFILSLLMAVIELTNENPTTLLLAKVLLYFSIINFFIFMILFILRILPPIAHEGHLPM